jgi:cytochrome P450
MRIIRDPSTVTQILRDRSLQMAGPVKRMLGPLLGEGVILATGDQHTQLRKQIGKLPRIDLDAILDAWTPPSGPVDLAEQMSLLAESTIGALFNTSLAGVAPLVRRCVALAPFRLLGLPLDWPWLRRLNARLADLPPWAEDATDTMTAKQRRDWAASFVVAGIDTMSSDLTAQLVGVKLLPIYWLPRRNVETGELVILMLQEEHKFGAGFRRCAGEHIAREMARLMLERFRIEVVSADLRKVGLITQRLRRVTCVITRR